MTQKYDTSKEAINLEIQILKAGGHHHLATILTLLIDELETLRAKKTK
jgi:hypothetical protein